MRTLSLILAAALTLPALALGAEDLTPEAFLPRHEKTHAHEPSAAFGKDVFLVVWRAGMNEAADIVGLRLDKTGKALDSKPFVVSGAKDCQERPRVASNGKGFLVVWQDLRDGKDWDVYAARVSPDGKVLDADGILVAGGENNQCEPAVCSDGKVFQTVWRQWNKRGGYDIHGTRVSPSGQVLDGPGGVFLVNPKMSGGRQQISMCTPGVGALPDGTLVAGAQLRKTLRLWTMRDGKVAGKVATVPGDKYNDEAMFASDGKGLLAVWTTLMIGGGRSSGGKSSGLLLIRGPSDLAGQPKSLGTSKPARTDTPHVRHPVPAWDGKSYVVAWDNECMGAGKVRFDAVFLRRIGADGKGLGPDQRIAGEQGSPAFRPAVASDGKGTTLVFYERHPATGKEPIKIGVRLLRAK